MRAIIVALFVTVLCLSQSASAQEVIGPDDVAEAVAVDVSVVGAPAAAPAAPAAPADNKFLISFDLAVYWEKLRGFVVEILHVTLIGLLTGGVGWGLSKLVGASRARLVMEAMRNSAGFAWENMGRQMKHELKGGKFDGDHRAKLFNYAYEHTKTLLKGAALKLFESYSPSTALTMFSDIVNKRKAIAGIGKPNAVSAPTA